MTRLVVLCLLFGSSALADVALPELPSVACAGKRAGDACATSGRCEARTVRRPDFSTSPPTWGVVEVLVCVEPPASRLRAFAPASAIALMLAALALWRRRVVARPG